MRWASMGRKKNEAGGEKQGRGVNESQQESRLNDGKDLISKIHKSASSQWGDKGTASKSTFPQRQSPKEVSGSDQVIRFGSQT